MYIMLPDNVDKVVNQSGGIHLIGTLLIEISGSDQDFSPDNHCYDR